MDKQEMVEVPDQEDREARLGQQPLRSAKLSGRQIQQIRDALLDGYPTPNQLRMMVRIELNEGLEAIASGENQRVLIFNLVSWAEQTGRINELIAGALNQNRGNPALQQLEQDWDRQTATSTAQDSISGESTFVVPSGPASIDIFLSYNHKDSEAMHQVQDVLRHAGLSVWTDEGLEPGTQSWQDAISEAISQSRFVVVLLSPSANASSWVKKEIGFAQTNGKRVIPILILGDETTAVPISLSDSQWIDGRKNVVDAATHQLLPALIRRFETPEPADSTQIDGSKQPTVEAAVSTELIKPPGPIWQKWPLSRIIAVGAIILIVLLLGYWVYIRPPYVQPPSTLKIEFVGRVTDSDSQRPIPNAKVSLEPPGTTPKTTYTDSEGVFEFVIVGDDTGRACMLAVGAENYQAFEGRIECSARQDLQIQLTSIPASVTPKETPTPLVRIASVPTSVSGKITFMRGARRFFIANADGSNEQLISEESMWCPRISPDGKKIAFVFWEDSKADIFVIDSDGSSLSNVSRTVNSDENCPAWSPMGTMLLYARQYSIDNDLYLMNTDGSGQRNLTQSHLRGLSAMYGYTASPWSPDGTRIVIQAPGYLSLLAGEEETDLTETFLGDLDIYTMTVDGANLTQIATDSTTNPPFSSHPNDYNAVWSPDGSHIAFVSTRGVNGEADIYVLDLDHIAQGPVNITNSPAIDTDPAWSPDGRRILFVSDRDANREIYVMSRDGSEVRKITNTLEDEENPYWIP